MSEPAWRCVCEAELSSQLTGQDFSERLEAANASPVDDYYTYVEHLLTLGDEASLTSSPTLGRLLLLGLVSGVESYLRSIIAASVRVCPVARQAAADQMLPFGAIDFYGSKHVELGLFDTASLAGGTEIRKRTNGILGVNIKQGSSLDAALSEFDKICHLRHAAVHARGTLGRGNAVALALGNYDGQRALRVSFSALQHAGLVCHSTVRAYNRAIFRALVERWIAEDLLSGVWAQDRESFKPLFDLFRSQKDSVGPANAYQAHRSLSAVL